MPSNRSPRIGPYLLIALASILFGGCLTAERKILSYTLKPDGSGTGRIVFQNLMTVEDDGTDVSLHDYNELVTTYLTGTKFNSLYPELMNMKKRLFEDNGKLSGEITFDFASYTDVGLYRYENVGPYMYHIGSISDIATERFETSNGDLPGGRMPVVFWPDSTREFMIVAGITKPTRETSSLLPLYFRLGTNP